ncbi:hypothetical protein G7Y79_00051g086740 [Physcia stellaris]|nr:hypothetical protein G7Y79_00051g086740 [Physcia stellaris]
MNVPEGLPKAAGTSYRIKACEACRHRKIKCDKSNPCSSCRALHIPCHTLAVAPPPSRKRTRDTVSEQWEEQFDRIDSRLYRLEHIVQTNAETCGPEHTPVSVEVPPEDSFYRGDSSFEFHSGATGQVLRDAISDPEYRRARRESPTSLSAIQNFVHANKSCNHGHFEHDLKMPSRDLVLKAVRLTKETRQRLLLSFAILDVDDFIRRCQKVYFPVDGYSSADFIIVHATLKCFFQNTLDTDLQKLGLSRSAAQATLNLCQKNIETAVERLSIILQPCLDNIQALMLGAHVTLEESKLSMSWSLISMAARLCLDAGLHRLNDDSPDPQLNLKKRCFWAVYALEKIQALSFGRASNMQDFDITTSYPNMYPWLRHGPWHELSYCFWDVAKVQSQIYEKLYSAYGRHQNSALKLESRDFGEMIIPTEFHAVTGTYTMSLLSTLTLVHAAIRPTDSPLDFSPECVSTARKCLVLHCELSEKFMAQADDCWRQYIHWGLLVSPFMPFLALLGAAISNTGNENDRKLLSHVVVSLKQAAENAPAAKKLYDVCRVLHSTALKTIDEAKARQNSHHTTTSSNQSGTSNELFNQRGEQNHQDLSTQNRSQMTDRGAAADMEAFTSSANPQSAPGMSDNANEISMWFEDYMGGNTSMFDLLDMDQPAMDWDWPST